MHCLWSRSLLSLGLAMPALVADLSPAARHMPKHKQKKIANETLTIFVPLARVLGLYNIKEELEDLSFKYSQPEEYDYLMK